MTALTLNLTKAQQSLTLCLQKKGIITPPVIDMELSMDVSGSFKQEHESGITTALMSRLVPWGLTFDPDKKLDVLTFSDGVNHVADVGPITADNYQGFVANKIINKVPGWCHGTNYSYVIEQALRVFGWLNDQSPKTGFFGKLFGKKNQETEQVKRPAVSIIITDGDNSDKARTEKVLQESQDRGDKVYFIFLGISNNPTEFDFIDSLADRFPNVGIVKIKDLNAFLKLSDDELNEKLITDEFVTWLKN